MGTTSLKLRRLRGRDLDRVCEIEEEVFPMPWSRSSFESEVEDASTAFHWVAERNGELVGYIVSWLVEDELHIGNLAVAPGLRRRGIGRALLSHCLGRAIERGLAHATLEVRASNVPAMTLYETAGFRPVAIRKRYYSDSGEDAIVMLKVFADGNGGA